MTGEPEEYRPDLIELIAASLIQGARNEATLQTLKACLAGAVARLTGEKLVDVLATMARREEAIYRQLRREMEEDIGLVQDEEDGDTPLDLEDFWDDR